MHWKATCAVLVLALALMTAEVSARRGGSRGQGGGGQGGGGQGGRGSGSHGGHSSGGHSSGERGIDGFLARINDTGVCEAYLNASVEDRASCTDYFLAEISPGRGPSLLRFATRFVCLADGVEANNTCQILAVACDVDEADTLVDCNRTRGSGRPDGRPGRPGRRSRDTRGNQRGQSGGLSGLDGQGGRSHGAEGERGLNGFLTRVNASGVCDDYLETSVEDREACTDEFLGELVPGRSQRRFRFVTRFICLPGGEEAENVCEILDVACNSDEADTLEICPRPEGGRGRQRRSSSSSSSSSSEEVSREDEDMTTSNMTTVSVP